MSTLTGLRVRNFKSIGEAGVDLELRPLTLLVGPNASGKSSILEALAVLAQSISAPIASRGHLVTFRDGDEMFYRRDPRAWVSFGLSNQNKTYEYAFRQADNEYKQIVRAPNHAEVTSTFECVERRLDGGSFRRLLGIAPDGPFEAISNIQPERVLDPMAFEYTGSGTGLDRYRNELHECQEIVRAFASALTGKVFLLRSVRGVRVGPSEGSSSEQPSWVGPLGEHLIPVLNELNKGTYRKIKRRVREWGERFALKELTGYASGGVQDADYDDDRIGVTLPLRSSSSGSRQVAPIIVQLFWSEPGSIVMIEEPEISLHPQGQVDMAKLLATAAREGKQVIATTHSTLLLLALSDVVRESILDPDHIVVYEIEKAESGSFVRHRLGLDEAGNLGGWVSSFSKVERELLRGWTSALTEV